MSVWQSPHVRAIASVAFLSAVVTTIAGLQFRTIASQTIRDPNQLAAFFGSFNIQASALALVCQIVLTPRVLDVIGVSALTIAPTILGIASCGLWCCGTLTAATVLKGADHAIRYSIDRSAMDMTCRPLGEQQLLEVRTLIDALVARWGDTAGALLTLFGTGVLHLDVRSLTAITIVLLVPWLASAIVARREYRSQLLHALQSSRALAAWSGAPATRLRGGVFDPDPLVRLEAVRTLTRHGIRRKRSSAERARLVTAVDAEIVGFALLADSPGQFEVADFRRAGAAAIERIMRLLMLMAPDRYPESLLSRTDADGRPDPVATEYLDATLDRERRHVLVEALDRWKKATRRD